MKCEPRWGDGLSTSNSVRVERPSPHPGTHLAMRADPRASFARLGPLKGRVKRVSYNPNTIFATISRWISDEPPKIVYARPLRYSGTTGSNSSGIPGASLSLERSHRFDIEAVIADHVDAEPRHRLADFADAQF